MLNVLFSTRRARRRPGRWRRRAKRPPRRTHIGTSQSTHNGTAVERRPGGRSPQPGDGRAPLVAAGARVGGGGSRLLPDAPWRSTRRRWSIHDGLSFAEHVLARGRAWRRSARSSRWCRRWPTTGARASTTRPSSRAPASTRTPPCSSSSGGATRRASASPPEGRRPRRLEEDRVQGDGRARPAAARARGVEPRALPPRPHRHVPRRLRRRGHAPHHHRVLRRRLARRSDQDAPGRRAPFASARVATWLRQLVGALSHVHALGLLHRDVKSSNVFLTAAGTRAPTAAHKPREGNSPRPPSTPDAPRPCPMQA